MALIILGTSFVYGEFLGTFARWIFTLVPLVALTFLQKRSIKADV